MTYRKIEDPVRVDAEPGMRCPACASETRPERDLFDDRYGYPGRYTLRRCVRCGHRHVDATMSAEQISDLYTRYYPRSSFDVDAWSPPVEQADSITWWRGLKSSAFRWVPHNVRVLDIGCGFGESLGYHRARGCDAHGVEADQNILRVAERHGLHVEVGLFDPDRYEPSSFDYVTLDQVIEHVSNPLVVLQGVQRVLKPGGTLVLSTPNADGWGARFFGRRWVHWHAPYHQQFFTAESMALAARGAGLTLEQAVTVTNAAWPDFQWGHCVTFPAPGQPSPYWQPSARRTISQRVALKLLRFVDRLGINAFLTRVMDWCGRGDNIVYVLSKPSG